MAYAFVGNPLREQRPWSPVVTDRPSEARFEGDGRTLRRVDSTRPQQVGTMTALSDARPLSAEALKLAIEAAQHGDTVAFAALYDAFHPEILVYLTHHLRHRETAEDLAQQTFLNAWKAIPRYQQRNVPLRAWLYRIARNQMLDHWKRQRPSLNVDLVNPAGNTDIEAGAIAADERRQLHEAMRRLSEDHREVIVLRFFMEKSAAEVGEIMGRKEVTVRGLQFRALRALRAALEDAGGFR